MVFSTDSELQGNTELTQPFFYFAQPLPKVE